MQGGAPEGGIYTQVLNDVSVFSYHLKELRLPSSEPRREGWFENVKGHGSAPSHEVVKFEVQNGVAKDGMCPPLKISTFRGMEGTDR